VNGAKVIYDTYDSEEETCNGVKHKTIVVSISREDIVGWSVIDTEIKSIVTKEQFEAMKYIVGDDSNA
jgi:hypothetical protein